jgi:hypothetical protein
MAIAIPNGGGGPFSMEILTEETGEYFRPDPDGFRTWVREHKPRTLVNKLMGEREEVKRFVAHGHHVFAETQGQE